MKEQLKLVQNETKADKGGDEDRKDTDEGREAAVAALSKAITKWYVRKDAKYYAVDRLNVKFVRRQIIWDI